MIELSNNLWTDFRLWQSNCEGGFIKLLNTCVKIYSEINYPIERIRSFFKQETKMILIKNKQHHTIYQIINNKAAYSYYIRQPHKYMRNIHNSFERMIQRRLQFSDISKIWGEQLNWAKNLWHKEFLIFKIKISSCHCSLCKNAWNF